jgi:hypothetical protein
MAKSSFVAIAAALIAMPAAAQNTNAAPDNHSTPTDRPILVFGAAQDHNGPTDRPILVFGAMAQDHAGPSDRPILVFGAIKDRAAAPAADDPADRALPEMPVLYEDAAPAPGAN